MVFIIIRTRHSFKRANINHAGEIQGYIVTRDSASKKGKHTTLPFPAKEGKTGTVT